MENNRLDQFFKDKLGQDTPVPFNPAHWEEAKKMLVKKKKNKKGFYWILFALLMLLSWGILSVIGKVNRQGPTGPPTVTTLELAETSRQGQADNHIEEPSVISENLPATQKEALAVADKLSKKVFTGASIKLGNGQIADPSTTSVQFDQEIGKSANRISTPEENIQAFKDPAILGLENLEVGRSSDALEELIVSAPVLSFKYNLHRPKEDGIVFRKDRIKKIRMGWSSTLLVNPGAYNSPVQGMTIGFAYERYFSPHWMYGMRPSLQLKGNEGGFSKFEQITTFGFSSVNTTYGLKANSLQFVSAPMYVAGEFGRHQFEAGFSVDLLLGARGQLQEVSVEDQVVSNLQNINSGWIDTGDMKKISGNVFVGYKNAINHRLKTGITFFYNPAKIYPGLPNNQSQVVDAKWYLGWQITYYVK